jgi:hypothetical protein
MHAFRCASKRGHSLLGWAQAGFVQVTPSVFGSAAGCGGVEVA